MQFDHNTYGERKSRSRHPANGASFSRGRCPSRVDTLEDHAGAALVSFLRAYLILPSVTIGRPPFPKAKLRAYKVLVSLSPGETKALRAAAAGEPLAAWIRDAALRAARRGKR
jgi:hypothetical protein